MSDRDEIYDIMKKMSKDKFDEDRKRFLAGAIKADDGKWTKHTEHHWSRLVNDFKLDYWPSRKKWSYRGIVTRGNVLDFISSKGDWA
jgi:hypothetical protein